MEYRVTFTQRRIGGSVVLITGLLLSNAAYASPVLTYAVAERSFASKKPHADPYNTVELDVVVTQPDGTTLRVPGFWAGERTWRFRYSSGQVGTHRWASVCSDATDTGLHGVEGSIEVKPYTGDNPLLRHGPIRVSADRHHFEHADGTPFLWIGDTWWMGLCKRLHWPKEFKQLAADRQAKGFNVIQIIAGLYPDMPAFDERGANEAGFPWERDYARIRPAYFDVADPRIDWLVESGLAPCIVGAWGYHLPWLGVERMKKHWRYLVARYGAYPVIWCTAGEGTMPYYLSKTKDKDRAFQKDGWTRVARYIRTIDPYHRMVSIHPSDSSRNTVNDPTVLDFDMLQTGHGNRDSIPNTIRLVRESRAAKPVMPSINSEVCYEGILDTCFDDIQRFMVWSCLLSGTVGHTYGANGIWQLNRSDQPYGPSPHGGNWGTRPWDDAARLPGSRQVGLAGKLLRQYEWHRFEPHPEWVATTGREKQPEFTWGDWIWFPEGQPVKHAPPGKCYFRRTFTVPAGKKIVRSVVRFATDDQSILFFNGTRYAHWPHGPGVSGWNPYRELHGIHHRFGKPILKPGRNVVAFQATNANAAVEHNPAGLLCQIELHYDDGSKTEIRSDTSWRCRREEVEHWNEADFDDQSWPQAMASAPYGSGPWGELRPRAAEYLVPYAAGIPGKVRIIYLPTSAPAVVKNLEPGTTYRAAYFDPVNGKRIDLPKAARGDNHGSWVVPDVPDPTHDWVLILEAIASGATPGTDSTQ